MERHGQDKACRYARAGGGLASAPVLIALAFIVAASLDLAGPGLGAIGRDVHSRAVARPLGTALVRAVRDLVGAQTQRPLARGHGWAPPAQWREPIRAARGTDMVPASHHVRDGLLNLPPPAGRA